MERLQRLYHHRALLQVLVSRELKGRYRGTVLGFIWTLVNPLVLMAIYVLIFSIYLRVEMRHYPAFLLCGIFSWTWFSVGISDATTSIIVNGGLIKKVYLPSEIIPLVYITSNMVHYLLTLPIQLLFLILFHDGLAWVIVYLPLVLLIQFVFMYALALILSSLAVRFRDLLQIVPNLLMVWFFITPVFYPSTTVPPEYHVLVDFNPMAHIIRCFQDILYYGRSPSFASVALAAGLASLLLIAGFSLFESQRDIFAEEV
ncbi:MAG: ABC transporter permease [Deltaproteobacteria bacterium]|nr:ABC transporter permease [Deltaproteobacteria bacterium]